MRLELAIENTQLEKQKLDKAGKEKETQHVAAEREKERQHDKDMVQLHIKKLQCEKLVEDSKMEENEKMRLHEIEKMKADQKSLKQNNSFNLKNGDRATLQM